MSLGNNSSGNAKGLFFIIDLVLAVAVVVLVLLYISSTFPSKPILYAEDFVFAEADYFLNGNIVKINQTTPTDNSVCRNIETLFFGKGMQIFKSDFCISIVK